MILVNNGHARSEVLQYPIPTLFQLLDNLAEIRGAKAPKKSVHRKSKPREPGTTRERMPNDMFLKAMMTPPKSKGR